VCKKSNQSSSNFKKQKRRVLVAIRRVFLSVFFILFGISQLMWSRAGYKNILGFVLILLGIFALLSFFVKDKAAH
jgi:hypothetical protein